MADAVGASFSDAVAHTSLIGAVILGVGTVVVAVLLPGREIAGERRTGGGSGAGVCREGEGDRQLTSADVPPLGSRGRRIGVCDGHGEVATNQIAVAPRCD